VLVEHGADLEADFSFAAQRLALAGNGGGNPGEVALGRGEQILALAGALGGERAVAADDEPLAGELGRVMPAMSRSSNSDICRAPPSSNALIAGARKAVIQSSPAALRSSLIRAWVIMPRSPTRTTWSRAEALLQLSHLTG